MPKPSQPQPQVTAPAGDQTSGQTGGQSDLGSQAGATMRDAMKSSMAGMSNIGGQSQRALDAMSASTTALAKTAETLNGRAVRYSQTFTSEAMAAVQAIATAKTSQAAIEIQTKFATNALQAYMAEFSAVSSILMDTMRQGAQPVQEATQASAQPANPVPPEER